MREIDLLKEYLKNEKLVKHCIAVGAIMRKLAERFGEDGEKWWRIGVLHDIDYEMTKENPKEHGLKAEEILKGKVEDEIIEIIKTHAYDINGYRRPEKLVEKMLLAADQVSGLIIATALVMPNKKLEEVRLETLKNKFKQKDFARRVRRDQILEMIEGVIDLDEFLRISLEALKEISGELGL